MVNAKYFGTYDTLEEALVVRNTAQQQLQKEYRYKSEEDIGRTDYKN